jgi:hypothetical protein
MNEKQLMELAIILKYEGNSFQQKSINSLMQQFVGRSRVSELKFFLTTQIQLGKVSNEMIEKAMKKHS